jgi:hypothetical protein
MSLPSSLFLDTRSTIKGHGHVMLLGVKRGKGEKGRSGDIAKAFSRGYREGRA